MSPKDKTYLSQLEIKAKYAIKSKKNYNKWPRCRNVICKYAKAYITCILTTKHKTFNNLVTTNG